MAVLHAKRELNKIGITNYKFLENDGAQCHIFSDKENIIVVFRVTEPKEMSDVKVHLLAFKRKSKTDLEYLQLNLIYLAKKLLNL